MITQLYVFSPGSFVVAEEWNANFRVIYRESITQKEAIADAFSVIAFPDSDLSGVYAQIRARGDCSEIIGNAVDIAASHEYYKTLANGEDLQINIDGNMNGEARILFKTEEDRNLLPFSAGFVGGVQGTVIIDHDNNFNFPAGSYYIMIYVTNKVAQLKLIWTGVSNDNN